MSTTFATTEDVDITLENLLSLALGNPEIGAVNFNFLHEVITEVLKHLGISNKIARITQEIDYRLIDPLPLGSQYAAADHKRNVSVDSIMEVAEETILTAASKEDAIDIEIPNTQQAEKLTKVELKAESPNAESSKTESPKVQSAKKPLPKVESAKIELPKAESPIGESADVVSTKEEEEVKTPVKEKRSNIQHIPSPPSTAASPHRKSSIVHPKRSSYITQRLSIKSNDSRYQDVALISRSMERRDSKTQASDMWHVLNINRRVEAAEAAIQGMTNLIDTINCELDDIKSVPAISTPIPEGRPQSTNSNHSISKQEQEVVKKMAAKLKSYDGKFTEMEKKLTEITTIVPKQAEIQTMVKSFCTTETVKDLIEESLLGFQPDMEQFVATAPPIEQPAVAPLIEKPATAPPIEQPSPIAHAQQPETVVVEKKVSENNAVQQAVLKKREPRDSRTRLAYQDISNKMIFLEQEIAAAKERMNQLNTELTIKLEMKHAEDNEMIPKLHDEINALTLKVNSLEISYKSMVEDVQCLTSRNDAFEEQQKKLAKSMRKLEQNLEDITDNFHRTQSTAMKSHQSLAAVESASITKIRGTLFDFQEIHSKLQNDIDSLIQDGRHKEKSFEEVTGKIIELQEAKVDKAYVAKAIETKAECHTIENKVNRDHFEKYIGEIDRSIQDVMQKIEGTEASSQKSYYTIQKCIDEKLDRDEANKIRSYVDTRFKNFKPLMQQAQQTEDSAAATRKKMIPNCNCISCDRPIDLPITNPGASLPYFHSLPGGKANRPVTTFDLQTIRHHMQQTWLQSGKDRSDLSQERDKLQRELLKLCGVRDLDELVTQTNRACGGGHTLIEQHKRNPGKPPMFYREEQHTPFQPADHQLFETEVLGRDGHIYKGRIQSTALPSIPRKGKECDSATRQPRIVSPIVPRPSVQTSGGITQGQSVVHQQVAVNVPKLQTVE